MWRYVEGFDRLLEPEFVACLPEVARQHVVHFCAYLPSRNRFLMLGDNNRFANHSDHPTCRAIVTDGLVEELQAVTDLYPDDEITEDYMAYTDQVCETNWAQVRGVNSTTCKNM